MIAYQQKESPASIASIMENTNLSKKQFFFFIMPATPELYTLSLHDALPISTLGFGFLGVWDDMRKLRTRKGDRKSTRLNSSHRCISYAVFCLKKKICTKRNASLSTE